MKWDVFLDRRKQRGGQAKDDIDQAIEIIERFAPRKYRSEREVFYYNYRIIPLYPKPLLSLLRTLAQRKGPNDNQSNFAQQLFLKLKAFYDPKDRLSLPEAKRDSGLRRRFRELFLYFYGKEDFSARDIEGWLEGI